MDLQLFGNFLNRFDTGTGDRRIDDHGHWISSCGAILDDPTLVH
jgi:hypothetical protein